MWGNHAFLKRSRRVGICYFPFISLAERAFRGLAVGADERMRVPVVCSRLKPPLKLTSWTGPRFRCDKNA